MTSIYGKIQLHKGSSVIIFPYDLIVDKFGGLYLSLVPEKSKSSQLLRDDRLYHSTVINHEELKLLNSLEKTIDYDLYSEVHMSILGVGSNCDCYYLVLLSRQLDELRLSLSLPSKDFHITVGFLNNDIHNIPKGLSTIIKWEDDSNVIDSISKHLCTDTNKNTKVLSIIISKYPSNFRLLKIYINELCKGNHMQKALSLSYNLINLSPTNIVSYYVHIKILDHLNMLSESILEELIQALLLLNFRGNTKQVTIVEQTLSILNRYIIDNNENPSKTIQILSFNKEESSICLQELPRNFSKVQEQVYGSGMLSAKHLSLLSQIGVNTVVNLIGEEKPTDEVIHLAEKNNIKIHHIGFTDRTACKMDILIHIIDTILTNRDNCTLVHCRGGVGRTNLILAGLLMKTTGISPSEAMAILKAKRKLIMSTEQILLLKSYYGHLVHDEQRLIPIPNTKDNTRQPSTNLNGLMMMIGLPCAGKSSFCLEMIRTFGSQVIHLNQDELGKSACEEMISQYAKVPNTIVLLDRCNLTISERRYWLDLYQSIAPSSATITAVFLDLGLDESLRRLKLRKNHLTLQSSGDSIVVSANNKLIAPSKSEGFSKVIIISSVEDLDSYKKQIGIKTDPNLYPSDKIIKFPRTRHITNLGSMTRDDLLMDKGELEKLLSTEVIVEEKIDGANLGFSLGPDGSIRAQNRSHFVHSTSQEQFKKLGFWIQTHQDDLCSILCKGNFIIYGEWLYAKHSIHYTQLPDFFVMFDLFDIDKNRFLSRDAMEEMVRDTSLCLVPVLFRGRLTDIDQLVQIATQTKSQFYEGLIEGVVVRSNIDDESMLMTRGKIVRSDFISGDQHWSKGKQTLNSLKYG